MRSIAICNLKGGVGKTTTAVNLSYLAAAGSRVLLWDLDPQAASTFAFRIRPHVPGFTKRHLENGEALCAAIKQTDYDNLCLLPADFADDKLDRLLGSRGSPGRVLTSVLAAIGADFDLVFLDCPVAFSPLAEAILAAADAIVVPAIPTVLSLRMVSALVAQAQRSRSRSSMAAVFNMVDHRKTLHRRACELAAEHPELFLSVDIPYDSLVEQMATRRMPHAAYAAHTIAGTAFANVWTELQSRLGRREDDGDERWAVVLRGIESLIAQLESSAQPLTTPADASTAPGGVDFDIVHRFDTESRDLERCAFRVELHERNGEFVVVARSESGERAEACIDRTGAVRILTGDMSPLDVLEGRTGTAAPCAFDRARAVAKGRQLRRVDTHKLCPAAAAEATPDDATAPPSPPASRPFPSSDCSSVSAGSPLTN